MVHGDCRPPVGRHPNKRPAQPTIDTHRSQRDPWSESLADWEPAETEENDPSLRIERQLYGQQQQDLQSQQQHHPPPRHQQPRQQQAAEPEPLQPVLLPADVTMRALAGLLGVHKARHRACINLLHVP